MAKPGPKPGSPGRGGRPKGTHPANRPPNHGNWGGGTGGTTSTSRIKPGDPDGIQRMSNDPDIKARNLERAAKLKDVLFELAMAKPAAGLDNSMSRINAIREFLNRVEGQPMATQLNLTKNDFDGWTDEQLAAEQDRLARALRDCDPGTADDTSAPEPGGVCH